MAVKGWAGGEGDAWDDSDTPDEIPPTQAGIYRVECVKATVGQSNEGKKPQITLEVKLLERYERGDTDLASPSTARGSQREWLTFDKEADKDAISRVKVKQAVSAFGAEAPGNLSSDALEASAASFVGQEAYAVFGQPKPGKNNPAVLFGNLLRFATKEKAQELNAEAPKQEEGGTGKRKRKAG